MEKDDLEPVTRREFEAALDGIADVLIVLALETTRHDLDARAQLVDRMQSIADAGRAGKAPLYGYVAGLIRESLHVPDEQDPL